MICFDLKFTQSQAKCNVMYYKAIDLSSIVEMQVKLNQKHLKLGIWLLNCIDFYPLNYWYRQEKTICGRYSSATIMASPDGFFQNSESNEAKEYVEQLHKSSTNVKALWPLWMSRSICNKKKWCYLYCDCSHYMQQ